MKRPGLLVVERHHLGDAVLALPFLRAAARRYAVTVICRPPVARFLTAVCPACHAAARGGFAEALAGARAGGFEAAVCAWPDTRAHVLMRVSGARVRAGFRVTASNFYGAAHAWRRRRILAGRLGSSLLSLGSPLLTHPLDRDPARGAHYENWRALADVLGFEPDESIPWLPVADPPAPVAQFVRGQRARGRKVVAVHAGGRLPTKRWPVGRFEEILRGWFVRRGVGALIVRAPGEDAPRPAGPDQIVWETPEPGDLAPVLATTDAVLCNDSFAAHVAAAVGVPVAAIFGSGDPGWFAPFGNRDHVIASDACRFRPCVDRCVQASPVCLEAVRVADVEAVLENFSHPRF